MSALASSPTIAPIVVSGGRPTTATCPACATSARGRSAGAGASPIVGFAAAAILFAILVAVGAPAWTRLFVFLPLAGGIFSWLQARRRFCAGFAVAGCRTSPTTKTGATRSRTRRRIGPTSRRSAG